MDDLIKRLVGKTWYACDGTGRRWTDDAPEQAAAALAEAQATIARQQVMLDRALEDAGEKMVEVARLKSELADLAFSGQTLQAWTLHDVTLNPEGAYSSIRVIAGRLAALEAKHG